MAAKVTPTMAMPIGIHWAGEIALNWSLCIIARRKSEIIEVASNAVTMQP